MSEQHPHPPAEIPSPSAKKPRTDADPTSTTTTTTTPQMAASAAGAAAGAAVEAVTPVATAALYSYWRSSCSYRVRIALALKNIPYEYRAVHLLKDGGQQTKPQYHALNPMGVVPTLIIDGVALTQSGAIIEYLEETRPSPALLPAMSNPSGRALVRAICDAIGCDIQPVQNLRVLNAIGSLHPAGEAAAAKTAWAKDVITRGFKGVETLLQHTSGKYCYGDTVTMADIYLVPQLANANRFSVDMSAFPIISRVGAALAELPAFKAAHPSVQPDAESA